MRLLVRFLQSADNHRDGRTLQMIGGVIHGIACENLPGISGAQQLGVLERHRPMTSRVAMRRLLSNFQRGHASRVHRAGLLDFVNCSGPCPLIAKHATREVAR